MIQKIIFYGICILFCSTACLANSIAQRHFPAGTQEIFIAKNLSQSNIQQLQYIAPWVENSIAEGYYPGAVILAAHNGQIIYRGVFGNRRILPTIAPMRFDTIFDLASLTKPIVTTTAVMQLVEQGKLSLDAPVAQYWPAFASHGKSGITIRELLTHTSGISDPTLPSRLSLLLPVSQYIPAISVYGKAALLRYIAQFKPPYPPNTSFIYSDFNFIVLGYLVERISGEPLDQYAQQHIFNPLGMKDSYFLPPSLLQDRIAPTQTINGKLRWGEVHDDKAYLMGGVAGMAGLFSDANDIGIFAQTLLQHGRISAGAPDYLLSPATVTQMTMPQTPAYIKQTRGLGWDIDSKFSARGSVFSTHSFGHTGWTGTSIWIDPASQTWLIILTSRTHPSPASPNKLLQDRKAIADMVGRATN